MAGSDRPVLTPHRAALFVLLAVAATTPFWAPLGLRRLDRFGVDRVEVVGTHILAPHEVLAISGISGAHNVWDDRRKWENALARHPIVQEARITRRLPGTLVVRVRERRPAGLVDGGTLRLVSVDGAILPVDLSRVPLDLPLLRTQGLAQSAAKAVWIQSGHLSQLDQALWSRVSEVRAGPGGSLVLRTGQPDALVMLPRNASGLQLRQLRSTLDFLARQPRPDSSAPARVDMRWDDQVVISAS
jgi:cell division protein FtsQ